MPRTPTLVILAVAALVLAGCGGTSGSTSGGSVVGPSSPSASKSATPSATPSAAGSGSPKDYGDYVALGDSYAAGVLIPTTDVAGGCFRSDHDYASLVATAIGATLHDVTCSAATTADFDRSQYAGVPPQRAALTARTALVTITMGGNDAKVFSTLVGTCPAVRSRDPQGAPCRAAMRLPGGGDRLLADLVGTQQRLTTLLRQVHRLAPKARVLAVGYPQIVDAAHRCAKLPLAAGDYAYAQSVNDALNSAVRAAARATGSTYVDVASATRGHDICAAQPWVNGATDVQGQAPRYHPFAIEHQVVARLVEAAIR